MPLLKSRVAIVTGGGQGIGRQIALTLASQGAKLALGARSVAPLEQTRAEIERLGGMAIHVQTDVSKESDCLRMVEETLGAFGRVDILVNNAGISGPTQRATEISLRQWQEVLDINLTGAWLASRAVLCHMERQGSGNILMVSSGAGRRGYPLRSPYAASKWAMIGLTQTLAGEWGSRGIRVNCICPGAVEGERIEEVFRARAESKKVPYEHVRAAYLRGAAMNRIVNAEECAQVALFLVSDLSSGITGQSINIDAGSVMS